MSSFRPRPIPSGLRLRAYTPADFEACMRMYRSNVGVTVPDGAHFPDYLQDTARPPRYWVVEGPDGVIAGAGLHTKPDTNASILCFGLVEHSHHGRGLGTLLLLARLAAVNCEEGEELIELETSKFTEGFYRRFGFEPVSDFSARYAPWMESADFGFWLQPEMQKAAAAAMQQYSTQLEIAPGLLQPLPVKRPPDRRVARAHPAPDRK